MHKSINSQINSGTITKRFRQTAPALPNECDMAMQHPNGFPNLSTKHIGTFSNLVDTEQSEWCSVHSCRCVLLVHRLMDQRHCLMHYTKMQDRLALRVINLSGQS
jgi:hypothetical protein